MRELLKSLARVVATLLMLPRIIAFRIAAPIVGIDRAIEASTEAIARIPGIRGQYLRRAFLAGAGMRCHPTAAICYGTILSKIGAEIEAHVYVGPNCHLGLVHIEREVLIGAAVHVPSGAHTHAFDEVGTPIRQQRAEYSRVRIGTGSWIGSGTIVLAHVGRNCVIAAGSVVTQEIPDNSVAAGVPARVIKTREAHKSA